MDQERQRTGSSATGDTVRIFIATTMQDSWTRDVALDVRELLEKHFGEGSVYLAAYEYPSPGRFLRPEEAYEESAQQIQHADAFVFFSPRGEAHGSLVELGLALAWGKPVLALVPGREHLPYLLQGDRPLRGVLVTPTQGAVDQWGFPGTYFRYIRSFMELVSRDQPAPGEQRA